MKIISVVLLGSLAMLLSVSAVPANKAPVPINAFAGKKISEMIPKFMYPTLRKLSTDVDKKIACFESKNILPAEKIAELKEVALKIIHDLPPTDPELKALIQSYDNDPRIPELMPVLLRNVFEILNCAKDVPH